MSCVRDLTTMKAVGNMQSDRPRTLSETEVARDFIHSQTTQRARRHPSHTACKTYQANNEAEEAPENDLDGDGARAREIIDSYRAPNKGKLDNRKI